MRPTLLPQNPAWPRRCRHAAGPARVRGAVAVEFGLAALILVPTVLGTVEFGRALYAYDTLAKSVRSAARYLAVGRPEQAQRQLEARCIVVTGRPVTAGAGCSGTPQLPGLTTAMVTILEPSTNAGVNQVVTGAGQIALVTVSVSGYPLSSFAAVLYSSITLGPISATMPFIFF